MKTASATIRKSSGTCSTITSQAADALGVDKDYRDKIAAMRDHLVTPGIGSWGQLLEWMTEKNGTNAVPGSPELDTPNDHHRHTSHLFAVYPGRQISVQKTPALAKAAKVSIDARGIFSDSDVREWSFAWRTALYARLGDAEDAHHMLEQLFSDRNTCPNLFGLHPPMQIGRQLRHYRRHVRNAAAIARRRNQPAARAASRVAGRLGERPARAR